MPRATYKLALMRWKSPGDNKEALENYQAYLKILPHGPYATQSTTAITRLKEKAATGSLAGSNQPK